MQVRYGNISAWCNSCASQHFELAAPAEPLRAASPLACLRCRAEVTHGELMGQIGDEAVRQARDAMATLKSRRAEYRRRIELLDAARQAGGAPAGAPAA
jgi:hypothetical protein